MCFLMTRAQHEIKMNEVIEDVHEIVREESFNILERLPVKVDLDASYDDEGNTLLHVAAEADKNEIVYLLLYKGADPGTMVTYWKKG